MLRVPEAGTALEFFMHISFQPGIQESAGNRAPHGAADSKLNNKALKAYGNGGFAGEAAGIAVDLSGDKAAHGFKGVDSGRKSEKKNILEEAASFDAKNAHNYMAVMSNTLSDKDLQELRKDGFDPAKMSGAEAVTNLDRIKVVLKEAGVDIAGFTDTVDRETAVKITGSASEAARITSDTPVTGEALEKTEELTAFIKDWLNRADLPATDDNLQAVMNTFETAARTAPLDSDIRELLLSKGEEPTVDNVYMAEHSGAEGFSGGAAGYFDTDGTGYYAEIAETEDLRAISGQIDRIIEEAGLLPDDEVRKDAEYLVKKGFALNTETLRLYEDLKSVEIPVKAGDLMEEITIALSEGRDAGSASLIKGYNRIRNERVLNETRLQMNAEANRSITSDNGFSLDTEELEEKVSILREKERLFYRAAFSESAGKSGFSLEESVDLAEETLYRVSRIKEMPAEVLGRFSSAEAFTVNDVYEAGKDLKARFDAANATYEAVGTEVRKDLGDRIGEAFKDIGGLLKDIAFEETADNLRAVRILGYNSMEITAENVTRVKAADSAVRTLIERLTGAVTVSLIKDGVNPLETGISELNDRISEMEGISEANEKFSEYLYRLERNNEISDDEAESYIGIYRLIRQIEKSDGAVTGALVNSGRELTLRNLLTELRTRNRGRMDYSVDDDFGGLTAKTGEDTSFRIDTQIETVFRKEPGEEEKGQSREQNSEYAKNAVREVYDSLTPEAVRGLKDLSGDTTLDMLLDAVREASGTKDREIQEAYYSEIAGEVREAAKKDGDVYEMLIHYGQEVNAENVNILDHLLNNRGRFFSDLNERLSENGKETVKKHSERLLDSISGISEGEDSEEDRETEDVVREAYGEMTEELEEILESSMETAESYVDLKALKNLNRCLSLASSLSREENYEIPMEINGQMTSVNLKVVRGTGEAAAAVSFESEPYGKVYAEFRILEGKVTGYALSDSDEGKELLKGSSEGFFTALDREGIDRGEIVFEKSLNPDINRIPESADIINRTPARQGRPGTENTGDTKGPEGKDAGSTAAVLYRTAGVFLRTL